MKKLRNVFLVLAITLLFTGCGKSNEEVLKEASKKMDELNNFHMTMKMDMTVSVEGVSATVTTTTESDIDNKNGVMSMETTMDMMGEKETTKAYYVYESGKTTAYTEQYGMYYKNVTEEELINFDMFDNVQNVEVVSKEDGKTYKVTLTKEQLSKLLTDIEVEVDNIDLEVTVKDKNITKMTMSLPMDLDGIKTTAQMTMTFSKFNEVGNVTVPEEVIYTAFDEEKEEARMDVDSYIMEIELLAEDGEIADGKYTATDLMYPGEAPSKVDVVIENGEVVSGIIEMNGYRATITDGYIYEFESLK